MTPLRLGWLTVFVLAACSAPGGGPDGSPGASGPDARLAATPDAGAGGAVLSVDAYCDSIGASGCPFLVACDYYDELADCEAFYRGIDYCAGYRAALADGRVSFDGARAARCAAETAGHDQCVPWPVSEADCERVFAGQVADGEPCYAGFECGAASYCQGLDRACPARCAPRAGAGEPADGADSCAAGLYDDGGTCRHPVALGESCAPIAPSPWRQACAEGTCDGERCQPWRLRGEACDRLGACWFGNCVAGECTGWAGLADACNVSAQGLPHCAATLVCTGRDDAGDGTCTPPLPAGAPCEYNWECDRETGLICLFRAGARDDAACAAPLGADAPCDYAWQCQADLYCEAGACAPRPGEGESCAADRDACLDGLWCDQGGDPRCRAGQPAGSDCSGGEQCASGACRDGECAAPACADPSP